MKKTAMFLSCKESARLLAARQDRALSVREKMALFLHLLICMACRRFERQVHFLHQAMRRWRTTLEE